VRARHCSYRWERRWVRWDLVAVAERSGPRHLPHRRRRTGAHVSPDRVRLGGAW
jgi:hypothetical protein